MNENKGRPHSLKLSPFSARIYEYVLKEVQAKKALVILSGKIALAKCQTAPGLKFKAGKEAKRSRNEGNEKEVAD